MAFGTFRILHPEDTAVRHNRKVYPTTILDPSNAAPLQQGEFLAPRDGAAKTLERHTGTAGGPAVAYPCAALPGNTDAQALGRSEFYLGWVVAETTTYNSGGSYDEGTPLKVNKVTIDSQDYSILTPASADHENVVAEVENPPTDATSYTPMRIRQARYVLMVA